MKNCKIKLWFKDITSILLKAIELCQIAAFSKENKSIISIKLEKFQDFEKKS